MTGDRFQRVISDETEGINFHLLGASLLMSFMPNYVGGRSRARILRFFGFNIGAGVIFWGRPTITGGRGLEKRLSIGRFSRFNLHCYFDLCGKINIGERVVCGPEVMLITGKHEIGGPEWRNGPLRPAPITICDGSWLGARALVMPGVTIGPSSVVAAGAVVTRDVPPNTIVAGTPAKVIRELDH